ncbi:hypothetical protein K1W69_26410 [Hoeflea sp. WL0058]|uniref:Uncharacterized protein n=1 Tax=Flavimaribacter sediminis TaxID=2865987 RepID=A0AAE2ZTG7_9HYPH|nr:hypothetical protein [Flavimaribacter sediminis]MBW8640752.1 hypothetical protein [Flavimaribacter sediminis]
MSATVLSMLFAHLLCNALAAEQPLPPREATFCSANFEALKLGLNPDLTMEAFARMDARDKAQASVASYRHYRIMVRENAHLVSVMQKSIVPLVKGEAVASLGEY